MEENKKIYIGNLEYGVTEDDIKRALEEKGLTATSVNIITDNYSGRSKGFGFAEFETEESVQQAIDALNEYDLNGRKLIVSKAQKRKPRTDDFGGRGRNDRDNSRGGGYNKGNRY